MAVLLWRLVWSWITLALDGFCMSRGLSCSPSVASYLDIDIDIDTFTRRHLGVGGLWPELCR